MRKIHAFGFIAALALTRCSFAPLRSTALPDATDGENVATIAILGTNDLHGTLAAQDLKTREPEGASPVAYHAGGVAMLASYVGELRSEFGHDLIWLDAGDQFQGSLESNSTQGAPMTDFLNMAGLDASAVGNHEFDFGASTEPGADPSDRLGALKARMSQAKFPYLGANIESKSTGKLATQELPLLSAHKILDAGKVKVGVLGLSTLDTPKTTTSINVKDLAFADLKKTTLREASSLRREGADVVVIVAHAGMKCERGHAQASSHLRTPEEPQGDCGDRDEMTRLLKSLPAGTVDAVVAGHTHQVVHHWVAGVPVIEGGAFGRYFNIIYLRYDLTHRRLLPGLTRIEGPVPVCPEVFSNQGDCNGERPVPKGGRGELVPPKFHGKTLRENRSVASMLKPVYQKTAELKKQVVATAARPIEHERFRESELGNIVTDAMRNATHTRVALMNSGGIRAPWERGPITFGSVFRSLPFDNQIVVLHVTGRELKLILQIAESGSRGVASVSGVRLRLLSFQENAKGTDLDGDGSIEAWEADRLLEAKFDDGSPISDTETYTLATIDFLINGGDDLGWIMAQIPKNRQEAPTGLLRDAVVQYMKQLAHNGPLNSFERPLINPADPRIKFEKPAKPGKHKGRRRRKKRV